MTFKPTIVLLGLLVAAMMAACGGEAPPELDLGSDGDVDGDSDSDTDGDGDSDSDADTDADADTDTDTDTDTDADSDSDSDADADADTDADTDSDSDSDADCPWECVDAGGDDTCTAVLGDGALHHWGYTCPGDQWCCQPVDAEGGIPSYAYCNDVPGLSCQWDCGEVGLEQNFEHYCNMAGVMCCGTAMTLCEDLGGTCEWYGCNDAQVEEPDGYCEGGGGWTPDCCVPA